MGAVGSGGGQGDTGAGQICVLSIHKSVYVKGTQRGDRGARLPHHSNKSRVLGLSVRPERSRTGGEHEIFHLASSFGLSY